MPCWLGEQLRWLVQVRLAWQEAKAENRNSVTARNKLKRLRGLEQSAGNMVSSIRKDAQGKSNNTSSAMIDAVVAELEILLEL
eukprot:jgi/Psemu1/308340/fgenesh1_kg.402_\